MVLMQSSTGFAAGLPTREGTLMPLRVIRHSQPHPLAYDAQSPEAGMTVMVGERPALERALGQEEPDPVAALLLGLQPGESVHVSGDLSLLERMPDDEPGADLQLLLETVEQVPAS
jgi:hypothetical protein